MNLSAIRFACGILLSRRDVEGRLLCSRTIEEQLEPDVQTKTLGSPFLPEHDVHILIRQAQAGDRQAFALVIEQVRPFIYKLARQYSGRVGGTPVEDLVQTGLLAAVRSVPCFDTSAGVKFVSYVGVAAAERFIGRHSPGSRCHKPQRKRLISLPSWPITESHCRFRTLRLPMSCGT